MKEIYAALLLHKAGKPVNEEGVKKILQATGAEIDESRVKNLVASLKDIDIDAELEKAVVVGSAPATGVAEEQRAEEPKEEKREAAAEGLSALFG